MNKGPLQVYNTHAPAVNTMQPHAELRSSRSETGQRSRSGTGVTGIIEEGKLSRRWDHGIIESKCEEEYALSCGERWLIWSYHTGITEVGMATSKK
jgi:hypothetical protein